MRLMQHVGWNLVILANIHQIAGNAVWMAFALASIAAVALDFIAYSKNKS